MKKKSLITMCVVASLIVSTFGATAVLADEVDDAAAADAAAQAAAEQAAAEQAAAEAAAQAAAQAQAEAEAAAAAQAQAEAEAAAAAQAAAEAAAAQAAANPTIVATNKVYDCDGSPTGYYEYVYSDGHTEYEEFDESGSGSYSGSSSESSYEEPSYEENYYEEYFDEEFAEEESYDEVVEEVAASSEVIFDGTEWTVEQIAAIPDVISGVENKEYTAGSASKYDIHMGVDFDSDIVHGVLFRTCDVDSSTPGEYDVTYLVYFNREALIDYMEENGIDAADFPGLEDESSDRIEIDVYGKVVID